MSGQHAIVIPAYNAASTVEDTLRSIQRQTPRGLSEIGRVVLIDDASTDGTVQAARAAWTLASPAFQVWHNPANVGERATCNAAFRRLLTEGVEWCFVLHADDLAKPHWLESLHALTRDGSPRLTSLCSSWDDWHTSGEIVPGEDDPRRAIDLVHGTDEAACSTLRRGCWWHFSGCAMHLPRFFEVGPFDPRMPQLGDLEWVVRCLLAGRDIAYLPRTLITYRALPTGVSAASFRTHRDLQESAHILAVHGGDPRLAPAVDDFLLTRLKSSARRGAAQLIRRNVPGALAAFRWGVHFAVQYLARRRPRLHGRRNGLR